MASVHSAFPPKQAKPAIQTLVPKSPFIALLEYDQTNLRLTTHLKSGAIYQHTFVMPLDFVALQTAKNPSKHWAKQIKGKKLSVKIKSAKAPKGRV